MVMMSTNNSKNVQEIFVEILLGRELLEVILNIISPTMALNLISYTTNFYREEYFETVVAHCSVSVSSLHSLSVLLIFFSFNQLLCTFPSFLAM